MFDPPKKKNEKKVYQMSNVNKKSHPRVIDQNFFRDEGAPRSGRAAGRHAALLRAVGSARVCGEFSSDPQRRGIARGIAGKGAAPLFVRVSTFRLTHTRGRRAPLGASR